MDYQPETPKLDEAKKTLRFGVGTVISVMKDLMDTPKVYRDKRKTFKKDIARRKFERDTIENQYEAEKGNVSYTISKDGEKYGVVLKGNKLVDGKVLTAFEVLDDEGNRRQNVYMDKLNIFNVSNNKMKKFMSEHIDFSSSQDAYIGRPRIKNEQVIQDIDSEFEKHFSEKQNSKEQFQKSYKKFRDSQKPFKVRRDVFVKMFESIAAKDQAEAFGYLKSLAKMKAQVRTCLLEKDEPRDR